ncbi:MAG: hypothetical protein ACYTFG_00500 [Planctomycetota bacterium]|jgi:hypothetical protein
MIPESAPGGAGIPVCLRGLLLASVIFLSSTGCTYLAERAHDWQDSWRVSVSAGIGAKIHVQLGALGFGAGYWDGYEAGYFEDKGLGIFRTSFFGVPVPFNLPLMLLYSWTLPQFIFTHRDRIEGWGANVGLFHLTMRFYHKNRKPPKVSIWWFEVDVRFFVGIRFGINIAEFADFLLGFFGIDIMGDDEREWEGD